MADPPDEISYEDAVGGAASTPEDSTDHPQWGELPYNIGPSAANLVGNVLFPITHPTQFAHGVYNIATDPDTRASVGQFYKERYGGLQNVRDTLIRDPVGIAADLAGVLTGGEFAAAKLAGKAGEVAQLSRFASAAEKAAAAARPAYDTTNVAGKTAQALGTAADVVSPVNWLAKGVNATKAVAGGAYTRLTGLLSQTGSDTISDAARAGWEGNQSFMPSMRGKIPVDTVVGEMESGMQQAKQAMHSQYQRMFPRLEDPIDTSPIHDKWNSIVNNTDPVTGISAGGLSKLSPAGQQELSGVKDLIDHYTAKPTSQWVEDPSQAAFKLADGTDFQPGNWQTVQVPQPRSIYQIDALKQSLGKIARGTTDPVVGRVINKAKQAANDTIESIAPGYAQTMDAYSDASDLLDDAKKTFGIGGDSSTNTKVGKISRIYSSTSAGQRSSELMDQIQNVTGKDYRASLAGQRLQSWLPGDGKLIPMIAEGVGLKEALGAVGGNLLSLKGAALAGLGSPKIAGALTYGANRAAGFIGRNYSDAGLPEPKVLGQVLVQSARPTELGTDPDQIEIDRAERAAGVQ